MQIIPYRSPLIPTIHSVSVLKTTAVHTERLVEDDIISIYINKSLISNL